MTSRTNNTTKIIAPIKIKQEKLEKNEPKDLCSYIDDRVGLLQQVFITLKSSKIRSMAPDCIQDMQTDELKELLLDELLGISTKRLRSIIEGTNCPSDTDSSDESQGRIIEHISLDEISDETENEFFSDQDGKIKKGLDAPLIKDKSQMSVLELLELQARARAIRSQLALEPVKEELIKKDKDEEVPVKVKAKKVKHEKLKGSTKKKSSDTVKPSSNPVKPVRNYRQPKAKEHLENAVEITAPVLESQKSTLIEASTEAISSNTAETYVNLETEMDYDKSNSESSKSDNEKTKTMSENIQISEKELDNVNTIIDNQETSNELPQEDVVTLQSLSNSTEDTFKPSIVVEEDCKSDKLQKRIKLNRSFIKDTPTEECNVSENKNNDNADELNLHVSDTEKELLENVVNKTNKKCKRHKKVRSSSDDCISIENGDESPFIISSESD